jgi:hypothetical protein
MKPSRTRTPFHSHPGVSLVISMLMVMAFMLLIASTGRSIARTRLIAEGMERKFRAELAARSGIEFGLYSQNKPERYATLLKNLEKKDKDIKSIEDGKLVWKNGDSVTWKITGTTGSVQTCAEVNYNAATSNDVKDCQPGNKVYYVYPFPGTGSVGGTSCNLQTQPVLKNKQWLTDMYFFMYGKTYSDVTQIEESDFAKDSSKGVAGLNTLDHPCLWNKVNTGTAAEIPLFMRTKEGKVIGPEMIDKFYVRARLSCKNGGACTDDGKKNSNRWHLAEEISGEEKDKLALAWGITATCKENSLCYLYNAATVNKNLASSLITYDIMEKPYSADVILKNIVLAFTHPTINKKKFVGTDTSKEQTTGAIIDFLLNQESWTDMKITKPIFNLSIASPLVVNKSNGQTIDEIEMQILYTLKQDAKPEPIITNPIVTATGLSSGYTLSLQSSVLKQTGTYSYPLIGK